MRNDQAFDNSFDSIKNVVDANVNLFTLQHK